MRPPVSRTPDDEELLLAVANTGHQDVDELGETSAVAAWWAEVDGRPWRGELGDEGDVAVLRAARRLVRALTLRNNGVDESLATDPAVLGELSLKFALDGGRPDILPEDSGNLPRYVAGLAVVALVRASSQPGWSRVKACRGPDCAWVFVDRSRNGSRRWCDMAECGNRAKGAAFRARTREAGGLGARAARVRSTGKGAPR